MNKLVIVVLLMRKTALSLILIISIALSLSTIESQTATILVKGNATFAFGSVQIVSPENKTYYSSTLNLSYSAVFPIMNSAGHKWIFYSLDGGENVTVYDEYNGLESYNGSVTLSGLSSGNHVIDIYSKDGIFVLSTGGSGYWDAVYRVCFRIVLSGNSPTPTPTVAPTPTPSATPEATSQPATLPASLVFVASTGIAIVGIGLFAYFKKRK